MPAPEPRPAATIVLLRADIEGGVEVLMLKRSGASAFMPGVYVFPGGRVDDDDLARGAATDVPLSRRFDDLDEVIERGYRFAAAREVEEEAALQLTDIAAFWPIAHWVTPPGEARRFDTRIFLAVAPVDQTAAHDGGETTEAVWIAPGAALERSRSGALRLAPPTWSVLALLARCATVDEALAWARHAHLHRIDPQPASDAAGSFMVIPGDPLRPLPAGVEPPPCTRFVLDEQRGWQPREP